MKSIIHRFTLVRQKLVATRAGMPQHRNEAVVWLRGNLQWLTRSMSRSDLSWPLAARGSVLAQHCSDVMPDNLTRGRLKLSDTDCFVLER
jgi:hypothetical protein